MQHNPKIEEKINKTYLTFVLICSALSLILVSASPLLFFLTFSGLTASFLFTYPKWSTWHEPNQQNKSHTLDISLKIVIGVGLAGLCIYFLQLHILAQMVLSLVGGSVLSAGFFENILNSQERLNESLRKAARESNLSDAKVLLERGADPFARDNCDYDAVRHAFRNHSNAPAIVEAIFTHVNKPAPKLRDLIPGINSFWGNNEKERHHYVETWSTWFDAFKAVGTHFSGETREQFREATVAVFHLYTPFFQRIVNSLILYLRHQAAHPNNFTGEGIPEYYISPLRLLTTMEKPTLEALLVALAKGNSKESPLPPVAPSGWAPIAGFAQAVTFLAPSVAQALSKSTPTPASDIEAPPPALEAAEPSPASPKAQISK